MEFHLPHPMSPPAYSLGYHPGGGLWDKLTFDGYMQMFCSGVVESVDAYLLRVRGNDLFIPSVKYEQDILEAVRRLLLFQKEIGVTPPVTVMLSLLWVRGYVMGVRESDFWDREKMPIDRDSLILPEAVVEDYSCDLGRLLKPVFDAIWNAAGWSGSLNYDGNGNWRPHSQ